MTDEPREAGAHHRLLTEAIIAEQEWEAEGAGRPLLRTRVQADDPAQVYSVRIPVAQLEPLRAEAARQGMEPAALIREWVLQRLGDDVGRGDV